MTAYILVLFVLAYLGMALGRFPGLSIDRTGIALVATIMLLAGGGITSDGIVQAIDFPTLFILFGLMIVSAQYAASGFYDWCALRIARAAHSPARLLGVVVAVAGGLSAVLANDVVVFAMTPMLCLGLRGRGLDPRPYLIALAGAANAGSAATLIGNPQNILIGQMGNLDFWAFLGACAVPAGIALLCVHLVVWRQWRDRLFLSPSLLPPSLLPIDLSPDTGLDRMQLAKAMVATAALLVLFAMPLPQETGVLLVGGAMLISRRLATRAMLGMVDWHLLVLFACLFAINHTLNTTGLPAQAVAALAEAGLLPDRLSVLAPLALLGSNTIGNVPAVVMLLSVWPDPPAGALYGLALLSTLAGNLLLLGSMANLIVVERAQSVGVTLGFLEHARAGIPMTLASCAIAVGWLLLMGYLPWT